MKISVLIPAKNEGHSIQACVDSVLMQSHPVHQIIVVDDGSTDNTLQKLKKYKKKIKVLILNKSTGNKSYAQEIGMKFVTGDIVITTDADTVLHHNFVQNITQEFKDPQVIACAGYVQGLKHNVLTACRQIEYLIGQHVYKQAQSHINALFVIPGCAAAYRTKVFKKHISIDHDTVTEDLDFTYKHHRNNFRIAYRKDAIAYTQDPSNFKDYVTQLRRWYAGSWQNLIKHSEILEKPNNALAISLMFLEGLIFPFLLIAALLFNFKIFLFYYISYFIVTFLFALYGSIKEKRIDLLLVTPIFLFVSFTNYVIFIEQFINEVLLSRKNSAWIQPKRRVAA